MIDARRPLEEVVFEGTVPNQVLIDGDFLNYTDVSWDVKADDPGVFFEYASPADVHAAMKVPVGILPEGLVRGTTPMASSTNLKSWYICYCIYRLH